MARPKSTLSSLKTYRVNAFFVVFWVLAAHLAAIAQFTRGFLLTRPVLPDYTNTTSVSAQPPFERAVLLVVDALRHDFVVTPDNAVEDVPYLRNFPVAELSSNPENSFALKFMADPPTTTLQRLKGMTTGSLPAFVDAGSNFAGYQIQEDNWLFQATENLGPVSFAGDDTWEALFSHLFSESYPYPSLNVRDLDTVDNGVKKHLPDMIKNTTNKIVIGHMLGVDHVGHRYGPAHPKMADKLQETFAFVEEIVNLLDDKTVLMVMGDHGMDQTGNHGGDSQDELEAALWVYSKRPVFSHEGATTVNQIDLVPTISGLLGLPVPFNSLGFPIRQAFSNSKLWKQISSEVAEQIKRYAGRVGVLSSSDVELANSGTPAVFQEMMLSKFKDMWIQFDTNSMILGIGLLVATTLMTVVIYNSSRGTTLTTISHHQCLGGSLGLLCGLVYLITQSSNDNTNSVDTIDKVIKLCVYSGSGSVLTGLLASLKLMRPSKPSKWTAFAFVILSIEFATSFSNSYVIWEASITHYLLVTIFVVLAASCAYQGSPLVMYLGGWCAIVSLLVLRLCSSWQICREETASRCVSTFFEPGSSMVPLWTYFAIGVLGLVFPYLMKRFWMIGQNNIGVANMILNLSSMALMISVMYASLDNAEARGWLESDMPGLQTVKILLGRFALAIGLLGVFVWWRSNPPVEFALDKNGIPNKIIGFNNIHGSDIVLVVICLFWTISVTNKPPGILSLGGLVYISMSTLDFIDITMTKYTFLVPVLFDLLGHSFFYFTGHQATIPSIQWDSAFVAARTVEYPWSPITVFLNTMGPIFITGLVCAFSSLWRRAVFKDARVPVAFVVRAVMGLAAVVGVRTIGSMSGCYMLRRHLMTWKIFAPRYMFGGITLLTVDVACLLAVLLSGHSIKKIAEIFG